MNTAFISTAPVTTSEERAAQRLEEAHFTHKYRTWREACFVGVGNRVDSEKIANALGIRRREDRAARGAISAALNSLYLAGGLSEPSVVRSQTGRRLYEYVIFPKIVDLQIQPRPQIAPHNSKRLSVKRAPMRPMTETAEVLTKRILDDLSKLESLARRDLSNYTENELLAALYSRRFKGE